MLLGSRCTRSCRFCNIDGGRPAAVDPMEPERTARAVSELGLSHAVLTSVSRDDLPDGGAVQFVRTVQAIRAVSPQSTIELLTPDFRGKPAAIDRIVDVHPDVYGHNLETVPRLYDEIRPGACYRRSLGLLARAKQRRPIGLTKSGLMLGLGETEREVCEVLRDLRLCGVDCVTLGQYLRPTLRHLEVERYLAPEEFEALRAEALAMGFRSVASSPLTRSSLEADLALELLARQGRGDVAL
jgi:lipoic acid synthetase